MSEMGMSKAAAVAELQARATLGRQLLAQPVSGEADLERLTMARVEWAFANKKLLHQIFGDAAAQFRFAHTAQLDNLGVRPRFEDRVREFQELVIDQLADIEKLIQVLKRMG